MVSLAFDIAKMEQNSYIHTLEGLEYWSIILRSTLGKPLYHQLTILVFHFFLKRDSFSSPVPHGDFLRSKSNPLTNSLQYIATKILQRSAYCISFLLLLYQITTKSGGLN